MKIITKLIYFAVSLIIISNMILNYSVVDIETGIIMFTFEDFTFEVYPILYQSANFISSILDTGLLIVLLSLQKLQTSRHLKDNSSLETKLNLALTALADVMIATKKITQKDPYITDEERSADLERLNSSILALAKESTTIVNPDFLSIPDLITKKLLQKENFDAMLKQATTEGDAALIAHLTPLVVKLGKEILGLTKQQ